MKPEKLKKQLTELTEHEKMYKEGYIDPKSRQFPYIEIDGKEVMRFSYAKISVENNGTPFLVRKHSRFRDYPLHIHDWIEISYTYAGSCTQLIEDREYRMETGQFLLMAPNTVHTIRPLSQDDIIVNISLGQNYMNNNFFNRLSSSSVVSSFFINAFNESSDRNKFFLFHSENDQRLRLFIEEFLCEWYDPSLSSLDILNSLFTLIISELVNVMDKTFVSTKNRNDYVLPVLRYIESNYRDCTLRSAADEFGLNPNYLSDLLKKHTGSSFNALVSSEKLSAAQRLLTNSDMNITDIVNYIGYQNVSFFYRKFKERYGCMPGEYRTRQQV